MRNYVGKFSMGLGHWLAVAAVAIVAACGSPAGNGNTPPPTEPPAAEAPPPQTEAPAPPATQAAPPAAATSPAGVQESAAPEAGDGGEQLKLASATPAEEPKWRFQEGQDFRILTAAQGTTGAPDKIEVAEVFWYGCPHCYQFDPTVSEWAKKLPGDVNFVRIPVMWNTTNQIHARVFYTAVALGKIDVMHSAIFREIHLNKKMMTDEGEIRDFFGKFGVSAADFDKTFRSFAVESQLARAKDLTQRYEIRGVPVIIVNGKYTTNAPGVKTFDDMLAVTTELIERERRK